MLTDIELALVVSFFTRTLKIFNFPTVLNDIILKFCDPSPYISEFSTEWKGSDIVLSNNNLSAKISKDANFYTIRFKDPLNDKSINKWKIKFDAKGYVYFYGVASNIQNNILDYDLNVVWTDGDKKWLTAYGMAHDKFWIKAGQRVRDISSIDTAKYLIICEADFSDVNRKFLNFFVDDGLKDGELIHVNKEFEIILPNDGFDKMHKEWYPIISLCLSQKGDNFIF